MNAARIGTVSLAAVLVVAACTAPRVQDAGDTDPVHRTAVRWTPDALSSDLYESSPTFSPDGREVYFFRASRQFGEYRLLSSRCEAGRWTEPVAPPFAAPAGTLEADPALSADGNRLYYVSAREQANPDDLDIWMVERDEGGAWSAPARLPEPVNSPAAELLPRPLPDGSLIFGSNRAGGHGQGDIYVAKPEEDGSWQVENLGPPVSTAAYEYEAEISADGQVMVVVADRGDRSHLYLFDRRGETWVERGRVPARDDVFQVGPLLSPTGDRLLFAQEADGRRSGEWFLIDLVSEPDRTWPPVCR